MRKEQLNKSMNPWRPSFNQEHQRIFMFLTTKAIKNRFYTYTNLPCTIKGLY